MAGRAWRVVVAGCGGLGEGPGGGSHGDGRPGKSVSICDLYALVTDCRANACDPNRRSDLIFSFECQIGLPRRSITGAVEGCDGGLLGPRGAPRFGSSMGSIRSR